MSSNNGNGNEIELNRKLTLLALAQALAAGKPVEIVPSANEPWHYTVRQIGKGSDYDHPCDLEHLVDAVRIAVDETGYRQRAEEAIVQEIMERIEVAFREGGGGGKRESER